MRTSLLILLALPFAAQAAEHVYDVVVYGGTAGGVIAAVSASREGLHTALIEPTRHLGGMVSGGLGWTDYGKKEVIGGYALINAHSRTEAIEIVTAFVEIHRRTWPEFECACELRPIEEEASESPAASVASERASS